MKTDKLLITVFTLDLHVDDLGPLKHIASDAEIIVYDCTLRKHIYEHLHGINNINVKKVSIEDSDEELFSDVSSELLDNLDKNYGAMFINVIPNQLLFNTLPTDDVAFIYYDHLLHDVFHKYTVRIYNQSHNRFGNTMPVVYISKMQELLHCMYANNITAVPKILANGINKVGKHIPEVGGTLYVTGE